MKRPVSRLPNCREVAKPASGHSLQVLLGLILSFWLVPTPPAGALGFRIPNQDAEAIARGNAFVATADDPAAIYYNPAGITQLEGQHFQVGSLLYLGIYGDYQSPSGTSVKNNAQVIPAPTFYYTYSPEKGPLSFGFGAYMPFGLSVQWPNDSPFRTAGVKASLTYITLNPVVAWKICQSVSIAAGPTFNYSKIDLVQGIFPNPNILPGDQFEFSGDGWGYGFNAGLFWQPHPQWSFGASYRSASRMDYRGDATTKPLPLSSSVNTSSKVDFPQIVIGGISYRPTTNWNVEVDVDWTDWDSVRQLQVQGFPSQILDWQSSLFYEVGVTRYFHQRYYLSAGYFFSGVTTSDQHFTPLVPDTDLQVGSIGGGFKGKNWDWAMAVQIIAGDWRNVQNLQNPTVNGRYKLFTPTLSFSFGYHF